MADPREFTARQAATDSRSPDGASVERAPAAVPLFLRVAEAARVLRISKTAAYELANEWIATGGAAGMPAIRVGRMIRVPIETFCDWASIDPNGLDSSTTERVQQLSAV